MTALPSHLHFRVTGMHSYIFTVQAVRVRPSLAALHKMAGVKKLVAAKKWL